MAARQEGNGQEFALAGLDGAEGIDLGVDHAGAAMLAFSPIDLDAWRRTIVAQADGVILEYGTGPDLHVRVLGAAFSDGFGENEGGFLPGLAWARLHRS